MGRPNGPQACSSGRELEQDSRGSGEGTAPPAARAGQPRPAFRLRRRLRPGEATTGAGRMPRTDPRQDAGRALLLRGPASTGLDRAPTPPRPEIRLQGSQDVAGTVRRASLRRCGIRGGARTGLGRVASQNPGSSQPRNASSASHRAGHAGFSGGRPPAARGEATQAQSPLWLWWHGLTKPDLDLLWKAYVRRFDLEHAFRFLKQTLGWTAPRVRHPEQADRWSWLVLVAYAQLRLARPCVADRRGYPGRGATLPAA